MYQPFYEGEEPPTLPNALKQESSNGTLWGSSGTDAKVLAEFCRLFGRMKERDRSFVIFTAQKSVKRKAI